MDMMGDSGTALLLLSTHCNDKYLIVMNISWAMTNVVSKFNQILLTCFIESGIPFNIHMLLTGISNRSALQQDIKIKVSKKCDSMNQASLWRQPISNVEQNITSSTMLSAHLCLYNIQKYHPVQMVPCHHAWNCSVSLHHSNNDPLTKCNKQYKYESKYTNMILTLFGSWWEMVLVSPSQWNWSI